MLLFLSCYLGVQSEKVNLDKILVLLPRSFRCCKRLQLKTLLWALPRKRVLKQSSLKTLFLNNTKQFTIGNHKRNIALQTNLRLHLRPGTPVKIDFQSTVFQSWDPALSVSLCWMTTATF